YEGEGEAGLAPGDVSSNGGVVVELVGKRRVVDLLQLAKIDLGAGGAPEVESVAIEQAIAAALAELAMPAPIVACATKDHGELPLLAKADRDADWTAVADRLRAIGVTLDEIDVTPAALARC